MRGGGLVGEQLDRWLRRWQESEMAGGDITLEDWMRDRYPDLWEEYQRRSRR